MTETNVVGIDLGTSGGRIAVYDTEGALVDSGDEDLDDQTIDDWEEVLRDATPEVPDSRLICSVTSTSGTVVAVDAYGESVFDPVMYYEGAPAHADEINAMDVADDLESKGISISSTSPLPCILDLRENNPDSFEDVEWLLSPTTWLLYRLRIPEGEQWTDLETDWTNALKYGADITLDDPDWYEPLFEAVDLPLELLPDVVAPGTSLGTAESDFADDTNLAGAELYQGMTDGNASTLAAGCLEPGDYSITCGTTSTVKFVSESIDPNEAIYYHRHPIEGYLPGAAYETGKVLRWFSDKVLGIDQVEGLELAQKCEMGEEYELLLQGSRSPFFDPEMANTMTGMWADQELDRREVKSRMIRGVATGIAMGEYYYIPLMEELFDTGVKNVHLVGGGTPGEDDPFMWWNELRTSIWGREVTLMEPRTTLGAVIPAIMEVGLFDDVQEASDTLLRSTGTIEPDESVTEFYADARDSYYERRQTSTELRAGDER